MEEYPNGCGGCNASCCYPAGGAPPFNSSPGNEGRCSEVLDDGRCGIHVRKDYKAKPEMCKALGVASNQCCLMRSRKWRP